MREQLHNRIILISEEEVVPVLYRLGPNTTWQKIFQEKSINKYGTSGLSVALARITQSQLT